MPQRPASSEIGGGKYSWESVTTGTCIGAFHPNNMQFLYSVLSSNELRVLYILLALAQLETPTPSQLLNGAYNPDMINVK